MEPRPYLSGKTVTSLGSLFTSWAMWLDSGMSILAQIEINMYKLSTKISCRVRSYNIESYEFINHETITCFYPIENPEMYVIQHKICSFTNNINWSI